MINFVFFLSRDNGRNDKEERGSAQDRSGNNKVHPIVRPGINLQVDLLADRHRTLLLHGSCLVKLWVTSPQQRTLIGTLLHKLDLNKLCLTAII